jgi:lysyl-tRNA synthetase class 2
MLGTIRAFFARMGVMEVETPLLARFGVTDPHLTLFGTCFQNAGDSPTGRQYFLQTSPEFAMKRLLAGGAGSIYQICKAFRNAEQGRLHNPEFTLLEWYRVGFGLMDLIRETETLLRLLLSRSRPELQAERHAYRPLFERHVGVDPIGADIATLALRSGQLGFPEAVAACGDDRATWLDFLFSHCVQPQLSDRGLVFVDEFPQCLPSLARVSPRDPEAVERVEVFLDGIELANGFHELADATEQERRFDQDIARGCAQGSEMRAKDPRLLAALAAGLPDCSGIAIGLDRLLMAITHTNHIDQVLAFSFDRA